MAQAIRHGIPAGYHRAESNGHSNPGSRIRKKLVEASGADPQPEAKKEEKTDIEQILATGVANGISISEMKEMTLGQIVDYCIECTNRRFAAEKQAGDNGKSQAPRRKATQADWDKFWG